MGSRSREKKRHPSSPQVQSAQKKSKSDKTSKRSLLFDKNPDPDSDTSLYEMASSGTSQSDVDRICEGLEPKLQSMVEKIVGRVDSLYNKLDTLTKEVKSLKTENDSLKKRIADLESGTDAAEQYSRRNCLRVSGIEEKEDENTDQLILDVASKLKVGLCLEEISRSHRVGKPATAATAAYPDAPKKHRAIIVRFLSCRSRNKLYKSRTLAKDSGLKGVFINEDLTKARNHLLYNARQLVKSKHLTGAWSSDGTILIKDNALKVHKITSTGDFEPFKSG